MKTIKFIVGLVGILTSLFSFSQQTETRKLSPFSKLYVSGTLDALVQQGNEESVKIVAKGVVTGRIVTEISDNELHVYIEDGDYKDINVKVFVTYKEINTVVKSGTGNIEWLTELNAGNFDFTMSDAGSCNFKNKIKADLFKLSKTGSGHINLTELSATEAFFSNAGSGNLTIQNGSVVKQTIDQSGTATLSAPGLTSEECYVSLTGSGNAEVKVSRILEGSIAGLGNIVYNGNAQIQKKSITGSGKITKRS